MYSSINTIFRAPVSVTALAGERTSDVSSETTFWEKVESWGDYFAAPGKLFFGTKYEIVNVDTHILNANSQPIYKRIKGKQLIEVIPMIDLKFFHRVVAVLFLPISLISTSLGLLFKNIAMLSDEEISKKYQESSYVLPPGVRRPK